MLEGELDDHLGYEKYEQRGESRSNSRNGHSSKRVTASFGDMDIDVPWDRNSTFEPLLKTTEFNQKHQRDVSDIEGKVISMYAKGMTTRDISGVKSVVFNKLRKVTKTRTVFPTDDSLFKILILAMKDITAKWYGKPHNWGLIISQLLISFPDRISDEDFI